MFEGIENIQDIDISSLNVDRFMDGVQGNDIISLFQSGRDSIKHMNEETIIEILAENDANSGMNIHNFKDISRAIFEAK